MGSSSDHRAKFIHLYKDDFRHQAYIAQGGSVDSVALAEDRFALAVHWIDLYLAQWYEVHPIDDKRRTALLAAMSGNDLVLGPVWRAYQELRSGTQCVQILRQYQFGQEDTLNRLLNSISKAIAEAVPAPSPHS